MMNVKEKLIGDLEAAWRTASKELGIRVVAPFVLNVGTASHKCVACLPDFGGPGGMLIDAIFPPRFITNESLADQARSSGYYVSFINGETYAVFHRDKFREALNDWGFFGPAELNQSCGNGRQAQG